MTTEPPPRTQAWDEDSGGASWHLELDRQLLIPGQLVSGRVSVTAHSGIESRGIVVALKATEHWKHRESSTDAQGHTTTRVVTSTAEAIREPVQLSGPLGLTAGEPFERTFELPVPPDGPASLEADDAGLAWTVEAKLDIEGGFDSRIERPVVVVQPTAFLRAGAVNVGEFGLYESADVATDGVTGTITLRPMPLVCGQSFSGHVELTASGSARLQEIRAELRVAVKATVSGGETETVTAWAGQLAPELELSGARGFDISGVLPARPLPSIELPHGRTDVTFHVILARAWATDTHLERDVAIATTAEI
ncbi:MAG TPA: sporulation protein [Candidatus Limnocylindrales bacterium]|nr:sporulation protein [Candidatus Limnocylindrales bacterium]